MNLNIKLIKLTNHLFDSFILDGWENWSRWSKDKTGYIKQVGGAPTPGFVKKLIINKINEVK